jgi:predicted NBD/HSP70 family sugar kinase
MTALLYGGIEGGGTKFNCAVGSGPENILAEARFAPPPHLLKPLGR